MPVVADSELGLGPRQDQARFEVGSVFFLAPALALMAVVSWPKGRAEVLALYPRWTILTGLVFDEASYRETLEMAVRAVDLPAFRARQTAERANGRCLGIGFATFSERTGYGSPAFAARGTMSSLVSALMPSAMNWPKPNSRMFVSGMPTRFGPSRFWIRPRPLRSSTVTIANRSAIAGWATNR